MRLRQVALVAQDLEATETRLERLLGLARGYHDPGIIKFGLDNWVATIGDTYLEVVAPVQADTTAGRYLERRGGDGGYMVLLQVDDLEPARQLLSAAEARIVWNAAGNDSQGSQTEGMHVHPRDCGGAILSIDQSTPSDAWVWAGEDWQSKKSEFLDQITGVELQSSDPAAMAARWCELLGTEASETVAQDGRPAHEIDLDDTRDDLCSADVTRGIIRFTADTDGRGDGVSAFDVRVNDPSALVDRAAEMGVKLEVGSGGRWTDEAGVRVFFLDR